MAENIKQHRYVICRFAEASNHDLQTHTQFSNVQLLEYDKLQVDHKGVTIC